MSVNDFTYEDVPLSADHSKYTYRYHTMYSEEEGKVEILRHGETWLEHPQAAKAWIEAANTIEELRRQREELQAENEQLTKELCKFRHPSSQNTLTF